MPTEKIIAFMIKHKTEITILTVIITGFFLILKRRLWLLLFFIVALFITYLSRLPQFFLKLWQLLREAV
ncbi:MAG: hypothetical protein ACE5PV_12080 [Candidatus Poribacteria bacterium]